MVQTGRSAMKKALSHFSIAILVSGPCTPFMYVVLMVNVISNVFFTSFEEIATWCFPACRTY